MDLRQMQAEYRSEERKVTLECLEKGALIITALSDDDGLIFKDGRTQKRKRLIIIGVDKENEICYGSVLVNTNQSPRSRFSEEYLTAQYMLKKDNYHDYLKYDSYADCGVIFPISNKKLLSGEYFGKLTEEDQKNCLIFLKQLKPFQQSRKNASV